MPKCGPVPLPRWLLAVALVVGAFWAFDLAVLRGGTPDPLDDTWEYGVAARALVHGQGFRTAMIHPPLWTLRDSANTVPVLIHGPLVALLVTPAVAQPRRLDDIAWVAALFATLGALWTAHFAARRFGMAGGIAAAVAFTASPLTLRSVHHDVSPLLGALLLIAALDLVTAERPRGFAAGIVLGLAWLVRPEMLLAAPFVMLIAAPAAGGPFLFAFLLCAAPWAWHNLHATGSPIFNLSSYLVIGYSNERPGIAVLRDFTLPPWRWPSMLRESFHLLPAKWHETFPHAVKRLLLVPSPTTGWLAVLGALAALLRKATRWDAAIGIQLAMVPLAVMTLTLYDDRYLVPFLPLWAVAAAAGASTLVGWIPSVREAALAPALLVLLLLLPGTLRDVHAEARRSDALRHRLEAERAALAARPAPARALMFSDTPDFVAWTTGRPTVWVTREEYLRLPTCTRAARADTLPPCRDGAAETWFHDVPAHP